MPDVISRESAGNAPAAPRAAVCGRTVCVFVHDPVPLRWGFRCLVEARTG
jgi:hypothetical protein